MRPKELLSWLTRVESLLNEFSFEELNSVEATTLKSSFEIFRQQLQDVISGNGISNNSLFKTTKQFKPNKHQLKSEANLIANVSHELRTPLNGIIGFTDLLKEDTLNTSQLSHVNAIQTASFSLLEIINELLEYSKLSARQESFESIHFNFYRLLRDIVFLGQTLIVQKNVSLEVVIDPAIPEVLIGDPTKLSQVLLNLLGNAIKFVEDGAIDLQIVLQKKKDTQLILEFTIADNGIGIDSEQLPHIFDSYEQADNKNYAGTGLGLSIVKEIINQLDGAISVASNLGEGTTFKFQLPFTKGDKSKLQKNDSRNDFLKDGSKFIKGSRVLVFEDNSLNQRLITQRLKKWGCTSFVTDNPDYGITILEQQDIDLVLMDLRMPKMSGFEIAELIRNHKSKLIKQVPIIALTADFTIRDKEKSELNGIDDYLLKPYSPDALLLKLIAHKKHKGKEFDAQEPRLKLVHNTQNEELQFDLSPIINDCEGNVELVSELIQLYKQNILEFIGEVKCHLAHKEFEAIEFAVHKIKSGLLMLRIDTLYGIVLNMDTCCKSSQDINELNVLFDSFIAQYPKVEEQIDLEFNKFKSRN